MVLSVDYLRNVGTHFLLGYNLNHTGDAAYLNQSAASNAIDATNAGFGCGAGIPGITCAIAAGATISDYVGNGLDSPGDLNTGACNGPNGINSSLCFRRSSSIGPTSFLKADARSVYNAFDLKLVQNVRHPVKGVKYLNFQATYTLSRFTNTGSSNGLVTGHSRKL